MSDMIEIAEVIDRLNNIVAALILKMPDRIHMGILRESLPEIRDELKAAYLKAGGEDHWK